MKLHGTGIAPGSAITPPRIALLLPSTLLVTIGAQLLAPFMFVDLRFAAFL
jgi:hypothetical protein